MCFNVEVIVYVRIFDLHCCRRYSIVVNVAGRLSYDVLVDVDVIRRHAAQLLHVRVAGRFEDKRVGVLNELSARFVRKSSSRRWHSSQYCNMSRSQLLRYRRHSPSHRCLCHCRSLNCQINCRFGIRRRLSSNRRR